MLGYALLSGLAAANVWMTRRVWRAPKKHLPHKAFLLASIWLMPVLGAVMARSHLRHYVPGEAYRRKARQEIARLCSESPPDRLAIAGAPSWSIGRLMHREEGLPLLDQAAVQQMLSGIGDASGQAQAVDALTQAWMLHLRDALGPRYRLHQSPGAWLLSTLESSVVAANAALVLAARSRVLQWLGTLASTEPWRTPVILLEDGASYERYVAAAPFTHRPEDWTADDGVFIDGVCPHFASASSDLRPLEPMIVRELTRQALAHRPMPSWLVHGIAEHAKRQLAEVRPHEWITWDMLTSFWDESEIHAFWSGEAFASDDERGQLARELARLVVERLARSVSALDRFAVSASREDSGAAAAREVLGVDLGSYICAVLGFEPQVSWSPRAGTVV